MTENEADQLKPGDVVWIATFFMSTPPRVICSQFQSFASTILKDPKERAYKYECADGTLRIAARLHHTESEARQDVSNLIQTYIERLQGILQEWERE